jgi:hypothetical protein
MVADSIVADLRRFEAIRSDDSPRRVSGAGYIWLTYRFAFHLRHNWTKLNQTTRELVWRSLTEGVNKNAIDAGWPHIVATLKQFPLQKRPMLLLRAMAERHLILTLTQNIALQNIAAQHIYETYHSIPDDFETHSDDHEVVRLQRPSGV